MRLRLMIRSLWVSLALTAQVAMAQAVTEPPAPTEIPALNDVESEPDPNVETVVIVPDRHPLSSGFRPGLGSWGPRRSYATPDITAAQTLDSNPMMESSGSYRGFSSGAAELQAIQYFGRETELRYVGGVRVQSSERIPGVGRVANIHGMSLSHVQTAGEWNFLFQDAAQYSQGALAGDTGLEGMGSVATQLNQWEGSPGIQLPSIALRDGLGPDQSILSVRAGRISNTALGEIDRSLGSRDNLSASAFYSELRFFRSGLVDGRQEGVLGGHDRSMSSHDRLGWTIGLTKFAFYGLPNSLLTDYGELVYGRDVTGRLSIEIGAGPQYLATTEEPSVRHSELGWQARGTAAFHQSHLDIRVTGMRAVTGGSGILSGAWTQSIDGSVTHRIRRAYELSYSWAVAQNKAVSGKEQYDTQYLAATVTRTSRGRFSTYFSYNFQRQTAPGAASELSSTGTEQVFGAGIRFSARPIGIR